MNDETDLRVRKFLGTWGYIPPISKEGIIYVVKLFFYFMSATNCARVVKQILVFRI